MRHQIHQHPELSNREFQTAALVADRLRTLGLDVRAQIAHTGVVGILKGGRPGSVVALRADMDALPVTEDTPYPFTPYPFKSTVRTAYGGKEVGVAHACGHDVHTAIMLGVASAFAEMRDELPGTLVFVFQPAEEGPPAGEEGGAALMLKEGVFGDLRPSAIFGLHADADMSVGKIGYTPGATSASNDTFTITLKGKAAHAAWPQLSVDPVVMAAQAVLALQTIRSRNLSPYQPSVITVAQINGGVRNNIIPEEVRLGGTVRLFDSQAQDEVERRMREILDGVARMAGGSYELEYTRQVPVIMSSPELVSAVLPAIERIVGKENVTIVQPWMAADDFAYFAAEAPAFFFHLGTVKPGTKSGNNHTPTFMADDSAIPVGIRVMVNVVLAHLRPAV
jgi:amidohydrolase